MLAELAERVRYIAGKICVHFAFWYCSACISDLRQPPIQAVCVFLAFVTIGWSHLATTAGGNYCRLLANVRAGLGIVPDDRAGNVTGSRWRLLFKPAVT